MELLSQDGAAVRGSRLGQIFFTMVEGLILVSHVIGAAVGLWGLETNVDGFRGYVADGRKVAAISLGHGKEID